MRKLQEKILVIGRAGLDLYADPVNTPIEDATKFISQLGGSAANIAAGLAKQGNDVDLFSTISDDSIGDFVINSCKDLGINTKLLFKVSNSKNTLAIVDGKPKTCNLKEFLENFLKFREDVVLKKTKFDLNKAEDRAHILIGLSVSVENLDKVIKIIRGSKTPDDAKKSLLNTKWKINKSKKWFH